MSRLWIGSWTVTPRDVSSATTARERVDFPTPGRPMNSTIVFEQAGVEDIGGQNHSVGRRR